MITAVTRHGLVNRYQKPFSSLPRNADALTYVTPRLPHHLFMSRATGEVAPG